MSFEWNDELAMNIEDIDNQHKELFSRLNALLAACATNQDKDAVASYLSFLREYVAYHFAAEEREMLTHGYPGLAKHESEHVQFKNRVNQLYDSFLAHGVTIPILVAAISSSGEWLVNHIHKTDKALAAFLLERSFH
jgi:hemerythrin